MPAATAPFSYAQAAKGQKATSPSTPPTPLTPVAPGSPSTGPQDTNLKNTSANDAVESTSFTAEARPDGFQAIQEAKMNSISTTTAPSVSDASCTTQNDTAPSLGTSSGESRRDDDTSSELSAQRSVKGARPQGPGRRPHQSRPTSSGAENKRNRRDKKSKAATNGTDNADKASSEEAENAKETPPKPELLEAPIPTINPWHQRRDAMAKVEQNGPQSVKPATQASGNSSQLSSRKGSATQASNNSKSLNENSTAPINNPRKAGDADNSRKNGFHKSDSRRPEPVPSDDAASWPTPDTVSKEEKRKPTDKLVEKLIEKPASEDPAGLKGKQTGKKDWVKIDFVPTVNFQTPLPQHKGARPRGGARGGRDGTTRGGGHAAHTAKDGEKGSNAPANPSKVNGETRETSRDIPAHPRGSSVPPTSTKRGSVDTPTTREHRKHSVPGATKSKDSSPNEHGRDKQETRGERTRGGPRGRGNYHGSTSQLNSQHGSFNASYAPNGAARQNPYSPPSRQNQFNQSFGPASSRGGRGGRGGSGSSRGAASSNTNRFSQSNVMNYDHVFHNASVMGYPHAPSPALYLDPYLVSALSAQLSWYFSIQNLCRDMYLRKNMDSQGFAPLSLVVGFNRVSSLLQGVPEPMSYVRQACLSSRDVEFVIGAEDGIERLRTPYNPGHWVLPMSERNEAAQNDGPANFLHPVQQQYPVHPGMAAGGFHSNGPTNTMNHYGSFNEGQGEPLVNGNSGSGEHVNSYASAKGSVAGRDTVLKPTVPEFSPRTGAGNGTFSEESATQTPNEESKEEPHSKPQDATNAVNGEAHPQQS
ncbi:hypothetical protein jhhlp_006490 [Lomentospora prolificans]|uniref:HTH La-type RNA-binding domain-containing protein n=1 Tax=Lomentospora prolificans TaxID=41688 RepID=A0A2N3N678_9PEZI|nr:hypothetical protein jhhlp_006490 [Lomentospora prolificans]